MAQRILAIRMASHAIVFGLDAVAPFGTLIVFGFDKIESEYAFCQLDLDLLL